MNPLEKKTVMLNTVFNFGATLVSQFISVYLYIYTGSLPLMCLYIIVRIGLFPIFFMLGNHLSKRHSFTLTYTLGLVFITLGLVFSLLAGPLFEANPFYVLIVAAIIGSGEGFYYFPPIPATRSFPVSKPELPSWRITASFPTSHPCWHRYSPVSF